MNRGDVYWVNLDPTKGSEINKQRPCVILSADPINKARKTVIVVPLSTSAQPRPPIVVKVNGLKNNSVAVCDQIRTVDKTRLVKFEVKLTSEVLEDIEDGVKQVLAL